MLRHYYEYCLFKPIYWQCSFVLLFVFSVVATHYFSFVKKDDLWLKQQVLKNQKLEQTLQAEKNQASVLKQSQSKLQAYKAASRYLEASEIYSSTSTLIQHLSELAAKENMTVKQIILESEKREGGHVRLLIRWSLFGSYSAFIKFYFLITQQPYLIQMMQFKLEKNSQEYGGNTLYADLFIHVHLFIK